MARVKIKDVKTGAVKEVEKSLASDFIGTGKFKLYEEKKEKTQNIYVQIVKDFVKENAIILSLMLLAFVSVSVLNFVKITDKTEKKL